MRDIVVRITQENLEYWQKKTGQKWFRPGDRIYNTLCRVCGNPTGGPSRNYKACGYCDGRRGGRVYPGSATKKVRL